MIRSMLSTGLISQACTLMVKHVQVFNTPGANANAVKELVICSMLLASRGIVEGHIHTKDVIYKEENVRS